MLSSASTSTYSSWPPRSAVFVRRRAARCSGYAVGCRGCWLAQRGVAGGSPPRSRQRPSSAPGTARRRWGSSPRPTLGRRLADGHRDPARRPARRARRRALRRDPRWRRPLHRLLAASGLASPLRRARGAAAAAERSILARRRRHQAAAEKSRRAEHQGEGRSSASASTWRSRSCSAADLRQRRQERRLQAAERVQARTVDRASTSAASTSASTRPSSTSSSPAP